LIVLGHSPGGDYNGRRRHDLLVRKVPATPRFAALGEPPARPHKAWKNPEQARRGLVDHGQDDKEQDADNRQQDRYELQPRQKIRRGGLRWIDGFPRIAQDRDELEIFGDVGNAVQRA
jgi:hypothetical protein